VDGGAAANDLLMQLQADFLGVPIVRPEMVESTALGAARLAAQGIGWPAAPADARTVRFEPRLPPADREKVLSRWRDAVAKA
jgi:glycerol kinase